MEELRHKFKILQANNFEKESESQSKVRTKTLRLSKNWKRQGKVLQGKQSTKSQSFIGKIFSQKQSTNKHLYNFKSSHSISPGGSQSRSNFTSRNPVRKKEASPCHRCGQIHRVPYPAIGVICNLCRKPNHFSKNTKKPTQKKVVYVQYLKPLSPPPVLDSFSAYSAIHNNDQYDDDDDTNNDNSLGIRMQEEDQLTDMTHTPEYDGISQLVHKRQYVTRKERITEKPFEYI
ncbi:unnamed protein product [Euphydryas editha]|uniref:Uncharacterized protein n=1 Tax=Euphydryas editha TaxID=104508 RepID=A0AAU9TVH4_EUPED|nr:unnamed protein product [Euphydryas editha]